jgi:hypothetical protein
MALDVDSKSSEQQALHIKHFSLPLPRLHKQVVLLIIAMNLSMSVMCNINNLPITMRSL